MATESLIQLVILALIDSTSIGTLIIPLWLLLRRETTGLGWKVLLYLAALTAFYFLIGVLLLSGGRALVEGFGGDLDVLLSSPVLRFGALVVAVGLLIYGFSGPWSREQREAAKAQRSASAKGGQGGWGRRIDAALRRPAGLLGLALLAGVLELPTMLPYLAASGIIVASGLGFGAQIGVLAGYCLVMIVPALLLLAARLALGSRADAAFTRLGAKLGDAAAETAKWVAAIVGILLVRWACTGPDGLRLPEPIGQVFGWIF